MRSWLHTEGKKLPIVLYGHCDCGFVFFFCIFFVFFLYFFWIFLVFFFLNIFFNYYFAFQCFFFFSSSLLLTLPPPRCDRTGEMFGAYALRYLGYSWEQISVYDQSVPGRNISCDYYLGMMWYCLSLKMMHNDTYGGLDCLTSYQPECNYPYNKEAEVWLGYAPYFLPTIIDENSQLGL